ncbi:MAG: hypothetical protein LBP19_00785 [Treponema sp.]|jgi:hypothetical protein|nr:hypothetical protein [Treponema sp.]
MGKHPVGAAKKAGIGFNEAIIDSATMKVHRYGGGQTGVSFLAITMKEQGREGFLSGNINDSEAALGLVHEVH